MDDDASADFDATVARLRADGLEVDVIVDDAGRYAILREPAGTTPLTGQEQPQSPPLRTRPTRGLAIGLALVIAAVFAVVALTSTDEPEERQAQPSPTTTTVEPTLRVKPSPTPTRPVVEDGPRLLGARGDWEIFAFADDEIARIEPASGRITRTPMPPLASSGPVSYLVGSDRALIMPLDNVDGYLVKDGRLAKDLPKGLNGGGQVFAGPPGQAWLTGHEPPAQLGLSLRDLNGKPIGKPITLTPQFYPEASDARGGVIGTGTGGSYLVRPGSVERITTGRVAAVGPNHYLTHECDERARCHAEVIDRETGAKRAVDIDVDRAMPVGTISTTGDHAAIMVYGDGDGDGGGGEPRLYLIDLSTGRSHTLDVSIPDGTYGQEMAWSPDGRWLLATSAGELVAVDPQTARVRPVGVDVTGVKAVVIRR